ncbi:hypothetical protein QFC19_001165 [Naganishia cerealis]|uniref:Uncharacterized protein n=1 Tax=Naganishia cerealis TaxID=610337 RepID=A0ACC2WIZ7_9TREE|nr:hypothetical protein QFC19_001165 [Naganishia cerealis]
MNTIQRSSTIGSFLRLPLATGASCKRQASTIAAKPTRVFSDRKAVLYQSYNHILDESPAVLLFQPNNLTMAELGAIRRAIAKIPSTSFESNATLTTVRTGILSAVVNKRRAKSKSAKALSSLLSGPLALITCPNFSPTHVGKILQAINKALHQRPPVSTQGSFPVNSRMMLLGGIFEGDSVVSAQQVADIAKLPEMSTLHAQLVGLLESSGSQLVGTLQSAAGGSLVRTLQGLENDLKEAK